MTKRPISSTTLTSRFSAASMNGSSATSSARMARASRSNPSRKSAKPAASITPRATSWITSSSRPPENCWTKLRAVRSEEHTSELQSPYDLVCRLLLEKKKHIIKPFLLYKKKKKKKHKKN